MSFPFPYIPAAASISALGPLTISYRTSDIRLTTTNSYSFTSQDIGTASSDRYVLVAITTTSTVGAISITGVTVGGVSASLVHSQAHTTGSVWAIAAFYIAAVPTGTTATVAITTSSNQLLCRIGIWALTNLSSTTASDTAGSTSTTATLDMDTVVDGGAFVCGRTNSSGTFTAPSGFTEDFDGVDGTYFSGWSGASLATTVAETRTITFTASAGTFACSAGIVLR